MPALTTTTALIQLQALSGDARHPVFQHVCLYKSSSEGTTVFRRETGFKRVHQILPPAVRIAGHSCPLIRWAAYHAQAIG